MITKNRNLIRLLSIFFLPLALSFLLPLCFYRLPISHRLFDHDTQLSVGQVFQATAVWVIWVAVAVLTTLLLALQFPRGARERRWNETALWPGFVLLSLVGIPVSSADYFFSFPGGFEQVVKQLALAPAITFVVGMRVLQGLEAYAQRRRRFILFTTVLLLMLNLACAVALPLLIGRASPGVMAGLTILYGVHALGIGKSRLIMVWAAFFALALALILLKGHFRTSWLGSAFWHKGEYIRVPIGDVLAGRAGEAYRQRTGGRSFDLNQPLVFASDNVFAGQDINYRNLRFLPDDDSFERPHYFLSKTLHRVNHLGELGYAVSITPDTVPYLNGLTYYPLLFKPVPRLLWSDKPADNSGQIYGHRYSLLHPDDKTTSANLGIVIESWINGGWPVVVLSAFLFGVLVFLGWRYLFGESGGMGNVVLGMVFVASAVATESSMNLAVGGILYGVLVWWGVEYLIRSRLNKR